MSSVTQELLARFDAAAARLEAFADLHTREVSQEEWDAGQIWAHVGEFLVHWREELGLRLSGEVDAPIGRTLEDEGRLGAIARDRFVPHEDMLNRIRPAIASAREFIATMPEDSWDRPIQMLSLGSATYRNAVEQYLVRHLEEHTAQLDSLKA